MIYGEAFNGIYDAIERIEQHIGLRYFTDSETINGRLNNIETLSSNAIKPICEVELPISGDSFTTTYAPILLGDSWVVNNSVIITVEDANGEKVVHEWGDIEFYEKTGTLMGANSQYDGMTVTVTYFYNETMLYYGIVFDGGYPETRKISDSFFDLVIEDSVTVENQRIFIDSKGRVSSYAVTEEVSGDNVFQDLTNGLTYELYSDNGNINWRVI